MLFSATAHGRLFLLFFFLIIRRPPKSPLFPSTPLFRSLKPDIVPGVRDYTGGTAPAKSASRVMASVNINETIRFADYELNHQTYRLSRAGHTLRLDRKSTRLNSSHLVISYAVFCLKKKK